MPAEVSITKEEKLSIIAAHIKNIEVNKFNAQLSIIELSSVPTPDPLQIENMNVLLTNSTAQVAALQEQYSIVESE